MNTSPVKIDPLLEPFLTKLDDTKADELLSRLINAHTEPVIKGVIRYKLHLSVTQHAEAEDISQEAVLQLLAQLREFPRDQSFTPTTTAQIRRKKHLEHVRLLKPIDRNQTATNSDMRPQNKLKLAASSPDRLIEMRVRKDFRGRKPTLGATSTFEAKPLRVN